MNIRSYVLKKAREAKEGSRAIAKVSSGQKNNALKSMAEALLKKSRELESANKKDISAARKKGLSKAMIDRLTLTKKRINEMAQGLVEIANLPDPVGEITKM
ncbi:MAG TPA: gamma-glutamyl-phosphate reductase, partial [Nitrospirae bacterium]|nr:gamma-glutamyl-phosphate reductase [Nitrospirota bacterium]